MSRATVDCLRRTYEAFNRRDIDGALEALDPQVEWVDGATLRGLDSVSSHWASQFELLDPQVKPIGFAEVADQVAVRVHQRTRDRQSGVLRELDVGHLFTFREGRVVRVRVYADPSEALHVAEGGG